MPDSPLILRLYKKLPVGDKTALADFLCEIDDGLDRVGEDEAIKVDVKLIFDELITNIAMHGYKDKDACEESIDASLVLTKAAVVMRLRDRGIPFNPLEHKPKLPELDDDIFDIQLGGLGVFMVHERVQEYDYKYVGGYNVQTMTKELPKRFYKNSYFESANDINYKNEQILSDFMSEGKTAHDLDWNDWEALTASLVSEQQDNNYAEHSVPMTIDTSLQKGAYKLGSDYNVNIQICTWGDKKKPALICTGGILNTAERFVVLARTLAENYFVIGVSWAGRGKSDWLIEQNDYNLDCYAAHIDAVINHFKLSEVHLLGSSLGGSASIRFLSKSKNADKVKSLILNDTGYLIPASRRARRSMKVARHYNFKNPQDILRRYELANRAEACVPESFLLLYAHWQTKPWKEGQYAYSHDYRALAAYRNDACDDLNQTKEWEEIKIPVLLLHGSLSTALSREQCKIMAQQKENMKWLEIRSVGHTPPLTDSQTIGFIGSWLDNNKNEEIENRTTINPKRFARKNIFIFNEKNQTSATIKDMPLVSEFFVVRHGMTNFNANGIRCGSEHDVPLNEQGVCEAIRMGLVFKKIFDKQGEANHSRIYCGSLQRILKTASIIGEITEIRNFYSDACFDERWLGEFSGTPHAKFEQQVKDKVPPKDGEEEAVFASRVQKALDIVMHHVAVTPIIVTSRGIITRMLHSLVIDFDDEVTDRDVIYHFIYDHKYEIWDATKISVADEKIDDKLFAKLLLRAKNNEG